MELCQILLFSIMYTWLATTLLQTQKYSNLAGQNRFKKDLLLLMFTMSKICNR